MVGRFGDLEEEFMALSRDWAPVAGFRRPGGRIGRRRVASGWLSVVLVPGKGLARFNMPGEQVK